MIIPQYTFLFPYCQMSVKSSIHTHNSIHILFRSLIATGTSKVVYALIILYIHFFVPRIATGKSVKRSIYTLRIPHIDFFVPLLQQVNPDCQVSTAFRAVQVYAVRWARRETRGYPGREVHRVPGVRTGYRESQGRRGVTGTPGSQAGRDYPAKMSVSSLAPGYQ